jgi:sulfur relay (sulfurtransferase) DsrC/TusE family protein
MGGILTDINKTLDHTDHYLWFISDFIPTICNEYYEDSEFITDAHTIGRLLKNIPETFNDNAVKKQNVTDWLIDNEYVEIAEQYVDWFIFTKKFFDEFYKYVDAERAIRSHLTKQISKSINERILSELYETGLKLMESDDLYKSNLKNIKFDNQYKYIINSCKLESRFYYDRYG